VAPPPAPFAARPAPHPLVGKSGSAFAKQGGNARAIIGKRFFGVTLQSA
jgi:hypothetical protein